MRLCIIIAQYYLSDIRLMHFRKRIFSFFQMRGFEVSDICIDMRISDNARKELEFPFLDMSAYKIGLMQRNASNCVIVLNDTFFLKHPWRMLLRRLEHVLPALTSIPIPAACGSIHPTTDLLYQDYNGSARRHLSTFFIAANTPGINVLSGLLETLPGSDDPYGENWLNNRIVENPPLKTLINIHLIATKNPWSWKGGQRGKSHSLLQRKAVTVAIEYLFTKQLLISSGCIIPLNLGISIKIFSKLQSFMNKCSFWK